VERIWKNTVPCSVLYGFSSDFGKTLLPTVLVFSGLYLAVYFFLRLIKGFSLMVLISFFEGILFVLFWVLGLIYFMLLSESI